MPELRLVCWHCRTGSPTRNFEAALSSLFGGGISSLSGSESFHRAGSGKSVAGSPTSAPQAKETLNAMIKEAGRDLTIISV